MATTALVTGVLTTTAATVFNGGFASNANSSLSGRLAIGQTTYSGGNTLVDLHASGSGVGSQLKFRNDHNDSAFEIGLAGNTSGDVIFYNNANTDMDFYTNNALRFSITNSEVVVNDSSADVDFRVETDSNSHALFVDGGNNRIGLGTSAPTKKLQIESGTNDDDGLFLSHSGGSIFAKIAVVNPGVDNNTTMGAVSNNDALFITDNTERFRITNGGNFTFNEGSADRDFRIESDNNAHAFFVNGANGNIGINSDASGGYALDLIDTGNASLVRLYAADGNNTARANVDFWYVDSGGSGYNNAQISALTATTAGNGSLIFSTRPQSGSLTEAVRIDAAQNLLVGTTTARTKTGQGVIAFGDSGGIMSNEGALADDETLDIAINTSGGGYQGFLAVANTVAANAASRTQSTFSVFGRSTDSSIQQIATDTGSTSAATFTVTTPSNGVVRVTNTSGSACVTSMTFFGGTSG